MIKFRVTAVSHGKRHLRMDCEEYADAKKAIDEEADYLREHSLGYVDRLEMSIVFVEPKKIVCKKEEFGPIYKRIIE